MDIAVKIKDYVSIQQMESEIGFKLLTTTKYNFVFNKDDYYIYIEPVGDGEYLGQMVHKSNEDLFMEPPSFYKQVIDNIWKGIIKWRS